MISKDLREKFDHLAEMVADKGVLKDIPLQERIDALEVITKYVAAVSKGPKVKDREEDTRFDDFARSLEDLPNVVPAAGRRS